VEQFFYLQNADRKLLLVHSWSDPDDPVGIALDYYGRMRKTMGGEVKNEQYVFNIKNVPCLKICGL
jgi:hypothetical protein